MSCGTLAGSSRGFRVHSSTQWAHWQARRTVRAGTATDRPSPGEIASEAPLSAAFAVGRRPLLAARLLSSESTFSARACTARTMARLASSSFANGGPSLASA
eukprot:CAMPEP_0171142066 /NCGR_PEP_ID=MMETSP0766_2-20121228/141750_1 /TAXON_ID=439317 /ORGANISM="Gambierdiscus australes, Strain CAWD 149" /LENGTH=101 /DNA_ID=CAMNT_0011605833 /DNA_START=102 /DNA_END=403 /DNA_ORIENTATION=+